MRLVRFLQHWLSDTGPHLYVADFVPDTHPIRLWADTFPWDAMVHTVEHSLTRRFPKKRPTGGRPPVSPRVLLALELLKHELGESDEDVCQRLRTDGAGRLARHLPTRTARYFGGMPLCVNFLKRRWGWTSLSYCPPKPCGLFARRRPPRKLSKFESRWPGLAEAWNLCIPTRMTLN